MSAIKVLLVDDHEVVRAGFKMLLGINRDIEVVAEADRGEQAIHLYHSLPIDIVVMDLSMPGIGGLETIRRLILKDADAKILVFSVHHEQVYINRALQAGAWGYISKNSAPEILLAAIDGIMQGQHYIEKNLLTEAFITNINHDYQRIIGSFSAREFDIFRLLARGVNAHEIADELCLGYKTVANYTTQIKKKLTISSMAELIHIATISGVIDQKF